MYFRAPGCFDRRPFGRPYGVNWSQEPLVRAATAWPSRIAQEYHSPILFLVEPQYQISQICLKMMLVIS